MAILALATPTVLGACGSSGSVSDDYPQEFRSNYLESCLAAGGNEEGCVCVLEEMEKTFTYDEVLAIESDITSGNADAAAAFAPMFEKCI